MEFVTYCDFCGERINENEEGVMFKHLYYETLVFCNKDCLNEAIEKIVYSENN